MRILRFPHKNKKKPLSCTHFVCVAVDEKFNPVFYYVIHKDSHKLFPKGQGQFNGVKNGFALLPRPEIS